MSKKDDELGVADTSGLTDADWAEINKLKAAYETGGQKALRQAIQELANDAVRYCKVMGALFPEQVREAIKDEMAAEGITVEDLRELMHKLEHPSLKKH